MYTELGTAELKSGEQVVVARIQTPDADWAGRISPFLAHKGGIWGWQVEKTLESEVAPLESYYYLALLGDEVVANVATWEYAGAGIFGHVFTNPDHRRKGACKAIMNVQMEDFRQRGGRALFLGTGFDSPPWHIYYGFAFRPVYEGSGFMDYYTEGRESFEAAFFAAADAQTRPVDWRDWPGLTALTSQSGGASLRLMGVNVHNRKSMESAYLGMYRGILDQENRRAVALESNRTHAIAGVAAVQPDPRFNAVNLLDLFVHPNFADHGGALLDALGPTDGKTQAYAESGDEAKIESLKAAGFRVEATLAGQMKLDSGTVDVVVLSR